MNQKGITYLVGVTVLLGVIWATAGAWFQLKYRVVRLEEAADRYFHSVMQVPSSR